MMQIRNEKLEMKNEKRKFRVLFGFIIILFLTVSCTKTNNDNNTGIVEIKEKMFVSQVNDVYLNTDDYIGKTIKLEGLFQKEQGYDKEYCFVIRYGPGCCGFDGNVGFEVAWEQEQQKSYPEDNAWVEATGELKTYEEDDYKYLYLDLASLNVLSRRGSEIVKQ